MTSILITGATGMVGGAVLTQALASQDVERVTVLTRRPLPVEHDKLCQIVHQDYMDYSGLEEELKGFDACAFCLGVYTGAVPKKKFRRITVDYTQAFADAFLAANPEARFCLLSGQGADRTEKSRVMFARDKGCAENYLFSVGLKDVYTFRPGYIYPVTPREEPNMTYRLVRSAYPAISKVYANFGVDSDQLAAVILDVCIHGSRLHTWENEDIRLHKAS